MPPRRHNARTIAALTGNPGCARRAVLDAAGVDKDRLATAIGFPATFGQSSFAIARGNAFEARVKADGCAELLRLLRDSLGLEPVDGAAYTDLAGRPDDPADDQDRRHERSRDELLAAVHDPGAASLLDHPLLRLDVAGRPVYLEPDLVAFQHAGVFHVVEIKSFPVVDGQADGLKVAAAATQAAVYVLALRHLLGRPAAVSHNVVLVCPRDFANTPIAVAVDVRRQLLVLEHQLRRLASIDALLDGLPDDLTLSPTTPAAELAAALGRIGRRYVPGCLSACELGFFCRHEADGSTAALGVSVREELGGVDTVAEVLALAESDGPPPPDLVDAAALLRATARIYASAAG